MTRQEFLTGLREALEGELDRRTVQEHVAYYASYIIEETGKGRTEADVTAELGDPWVIARSIISMAAERGQDQDGPRTSGRGDGARDEDAARSGGTVHVFGFDTWWKKLLLVLGVIGIFLLVIAVIGGIFSLLMPILVPLLLIVLIFRLLGGTRR